MKHCSGCIGALASCAVLTASSALAQGAGTGRSVTPEELAAYKTIGVALAAALAVSISILGAGYAVGRIGSAAIGAVTEKPELLPRTILFLALAEGLAVLGFAVAMILLQKV